MMHLQPWVMVAAGTLAKWQRHGDNNEQSDGKQVMTGIYAGKRTTVGLQYSCNVSSHTEDVPQPAMLFCQSSSMNPSLGAPQVYAATASCGS
jgi:hypothetical protein